MLIPELAQLSDLALFLLRLLLAAIFGTSGWSHMRKPAERGESIGMSKGATAALGLVEVAGSVGLVLGLFAQVAALLLMAVMAGAIYKKIFVWKLGFWGDDGQGWYYDALYMAGCFVVATTDGGAWALT